MEDVEETTFAVNPSVWDMSEDPKKDWLFYLINISYPITIFIGVVLNILAFVILARCRLWLKHEGYLYLTTILCTNVGVLLFSTSSFWLISAHVPMGYYPPETSQVMCKLWNFLKSIFFVSGWPSVALLLTCYLRADMTLRERCPVFAAKYCTLFASKVVVGVVLGSLLVLGLPYLVVYNLEYGSYCTGYPYAIANNVFRLIETILMFVVPFIVLLVVLVLALCSSKKGNNPVSAQNAEVVADKEIRKMAITISSMILWSQFVVVLARVVFRNVKGYPPIVEIVHGLSLSIHPVLCYVILTMFRQGVRAQLRSIRCCRRLFPSLGHEEVEEMVPPSTTPKDAPKVADP